MRKIAVATALALTVTGLAAVPRAAASSPLVAARQHFFGAANVDPKTGAVRSDKLILSWASVATLVTSIRGHVVLLDTYIHKREATRAYVPATLDDLVALKPSYIFIGHGHFDHADTAGEISARTGTTIIGTAEHCAQAQAQAEEYRHGAKAKCRAVIPAGAQPGYRAHLGQTLMNGVPVTALKHVHSDSEPPDPDAQPGQQRLPAAAGSEVVPDASARPQRGQELTRERSG